MAERTEREQRRAYWKGHLRLSLVTISVELFSAAQDQAKVALHQIHKPSRQRIRYEKVVPGIGPVDTADIVKGFEVEKDQYVILAPEELDEIKLESTNTIELVQFAGPGEIDPRYYDRPYYLVPEGKVSIEGFAVIREALEKAQKVGIGKLSMRGREYIVAVRPSGRGMLLETLRYGEEVRSSNALFGDIPDVRTDKEMVSLASELIERKTKPFDPSAFHDSYRDALRELVERKRKGKLVISAANDDQRRPAGNVVDIMEALRRSVTGGQASGSEKRRTRRAPAGSRSSPTKRRRSG